ncbi:MAG: bifunctional metallophosphatase/5'-nucleotidase [Bryobacteraceae bacterium]
MKTITLLQMNDTHGYLEPHSELFWEGGGEEYRAAGGYARISALFKKVREERGGAVIALDNGDTLHGTYTAVHSRGEAFIEPLNLLKLDAWTAHWDFAYGVDQLRNLAARLDHPLLAINCYRKDTGELAYPPSVLLERGGLRVGIIGIAATIIDKTMPKHFSEGLRFTLGNEELPGQISALRTQGADLIVVLSHLGLPQDMNIAAEVSGIDVLVSGHSHNRLYEPLQVNGAVIMQSGCHGSFIGRLDLDLDEGLIAAVRHRLIRIDEAIEPDAEMQRVVDKIMTPDRQTLSAIIGRTETALHRNTILEAPMDNLLLEALAEAAGAKIAFSNGWRYGAPIPPGPVTRNDLWNIVPTNSPVSLTELTGREIWDMLEENLEHTFAADPYRQMGGYVKRCFGLNVYIKIENPNGARIQQIFAEGAPLDKKRLYTAAFVTMQGVPKKYGRNRRDLEIHAVEALESYFAKHPSVSIGIRGSVVAI